MLSEDPAELIVERVPVPVDRAVAVVLLEVLVPLVKLSPRALVVLEARVSVRLKSL